MATPSTELISAVFNDIVNDGGYPFDNIFPKCPVISYFLAKDKMDGGTLGINSRVKTYPGGPKIEVPLEYGEGDAMQFYDGWDVINFTPQETIKSAFYTPTNAVGKLILLNDDIIDAQGSQKKITDLVKSKLRNMNKTMIKGLNTALLAGEASQASKQFHSIPFLVQVVPSSSTTAIKTIGELDQSATANAFWRNQTSTSAATTFLLLMREFRHLRNLCSYNAGGDEPDLLMVDQIVWEYILAYADSKGTHTFRNEEISKLMNLDIKVVEGMNVLWDTAVPESDSTHSAAYLLNTDYIQFQIHEKRQFKLDPPITPIPTGDGFQDATAWTAKLRGQLTISNRNKQGVLHTISQALTA